MYSLSLRIQKPEPETLTAAGCEAVPPGFTPNPGRRNKTETKTISIISAVGGFLISQLGGWNTPLNCLVSIMVTDFLLGLLCGICGKSSKTPSGRLSSSTGFRGIAKKTGMLLCVGLGCVLDTLAGTHSVRELVITALCANECISVIENLGLLGIKIPAKLKKAVDALQEKEE